MHSIQTPVEHSAPWNKGKLIGQKAPLKLKEIWAIRIRLQLAKHIRDLALFNLAIDSKLRGCDLVSLKVSDVAQGGRISQRAIIMQQKTHRPVQFEIRNRLARLWLPGLNRHILLQASTYSPAVSAILRTSRHDNTLESWNLGWSRSVWTQQRTGHIPCAEPRQR